jgi:hypothetical protein
VVVSPQLAGQLDFALIYMLNFLTACRPKVGAGFTGEAGTASPEDKEHAQKQRLKAQF